MRSIRVFFCFWRTVTLRVLCARVFARFLIKCFFFLFLLKRGKVRPDQTVKMGHGVLSIGNSAPPWSPLRRRNEVFLFFSRKETKNKIIIVIISRTQQAPRKDGCFHQYTTRFLYTRLIYQRNDFRKILKKLLQTSKPTDRQFPHHQRQKYFHSDKNRTLQSNDRFASVIWICCKMRPKTQPWDEARRRRGAAGRPANGQLTAS